MPQFQVQFARPTGQLTREIIEAASERAALARVEAQGGTPISVRAARSKGNEATAGRVHRARRGRSLRRAVMDFTHQLTAVAESGIPIISGLKAVAEQTAHPEMKSAIHRIVGRIEGGRTLADAMAAEPDIFPELYVKTLAAGETAGKVPEVLSSIAHYQEQQAETAAQIRSALTYPALVIISLVLATAVLLVFVVPQFEELFSKFGAELPLPTRGLIAASSLVTDHYVWLALGVVALAGSARHLLTYRSVRQRLDCWLLKMPVFGNLLLGIYMVRVVELLDLLSRAALPITQTLRVTTDSMTNEALRDDLKRVTRSVEGGHSLTQAFGETRWLTPLVKRMLAIGEEAGRTDQIFEYLKKYYATMTQRSIKLLSTLIEPIMVTGLAAIVLFFALAIFLPMWRLLKIVSTA